jgi:hypothetical protein
MQTNERSTTVIGPGAISSLSSQLAAANTPTLKDSANGSIIPKIAGNTVNRGLPTKSPGNASTAIAAATAPATADVQAGSIAPPYTPRRLSFSNRMALPMPSRGPLSPVLDPALGYSVARRPRLDFARSCLFYTQILFVGPLLIILVRYLTSSFNSRRVFARFVAARDQWWLPDSPNQLQANRVTNKQ